MTAVTGVPSEPQHLLLWVRPAAASGRPPTPGTPGPTCPTARFRVASMGAVEVSLSNPEHRLCGHGIVQDPQQRVDRPRHLQIHRRREDLDVLGTARRRTDRHHSRASRAIPTSSTWPRRAIRSSPNKERGVYRTTDGGKTWKQVLFLSDTAGAADLELQPGNPESDFRLHVARAAQAVDHHQRRARRRHLQEHRRRRYLDQARGRPAQRTVRPQQRGHLRVPRPIASTR